MTINSSPFLFEFGSACSPQVSPTGKVMIDTWEWLVARKTIFNRFPTGLLPVEPIHLEVDMRMVEFHISVPMIIGEALLEAGAAELRVADVYTHRVSGNGFDSDGYITDDCPSQEAIPNVFDDSPQQRRPWLPNDWPSPWPNPINVMPVRSNPIHIYPRESVNEGEVVIDQPDGSFLKKRLTVYDNFGQYYSHVSEFVRYMKAIGTNDTATLAAVEKKIKESGDLPAIVICPERVTMFMEQLEFENEDIFDNLFTDADEAFRFGIRYTMSHELGHYIFPVAERDLPWSECLANWFSYCVLDGKERKAMYTWALSLPDPYRYYLALVDLQMQPTEPTVLTSIMGAIRRSLILTSIEAGGTSGRLSDASWLWLYDKDYKKFYNHRLMVKGLFGEHYRKVSQPIIEVSRQSTLAITPGIAYLEDLIEPRAYNQLFRDIRGTIIGSTAKTARIKVVDYEKLLEEEFIAAPLNRKIDI